MTGAAAPDAGRPAALPQVVGRRALGGWRVALMCGGAELAALEPGQARALAAQLADMADVLETTGVAAIDPEQMWRLEAPETGVPVVDRADVRPSASMPPVSG